MKWILVILAFGFSGGAEQGVHSSYIEFNDKDSCYHAKDNIDSSVIDRRDKFRAFCVKKGESI